MLLSSIFEFSSSSAEFLDFWPSFMTSHLCHGAALFWQLCDVISNLLGSWFLIRFSGPFQLWQCTDQSPLLAFGKVWLLQVTWLTLNQFCCVELSTLLALDRDTLPSCFTQLLLPLRTFHLCINFLSWFVNLDSAWQIVLTSCCYLSLVSTVDINSA